MDGNRCITWSIGAAASATSPSHPSANQHAIYYDLSPANWWIKAPRPHPKGPIQESGTYSFAGITDAYFAAVFLPAEDAMRETVFTDTVPTPQPEKARPLVGLPLRWRLNQFRLFVGPKDVDLLKASTRKLEQLIDFGWMSSFPSRSS